jgi:3-oxoacyl-[acyl-carrier protein] reductase
MFDLTGKCALITGASGGIGAEIARALHGAGATIAISGTREAPLEALAAELGARVHVLPCNLSDPQAVEALPKAASEAMGALDILVNNAGITRDTLMMRMSDEQWSQVLDVNLTAAMRLMRASLRGMMKARWGRIINISSIVGATGNPGQANYVAAKAGLVGLSKALAQEVASRGHNGELRGARLYRHTHDRGPDRGPARGLNQRIPASRMGTPAEIAAGVLYLASPEAGYVTGAVLHINGGMAMV